jgi:nanoRNase/pAp phosphatase (c-di-AMP/oligoRNAs hydrolase)
MLSTAKDKVRQFYKQFTSEDRVLILINADPDAIASAMAVKRLLWRKVNNITISNINIIARPDNCAMVELLGVKLTHIKNLDETRYNRVVMVDSQPSHNVLFEKFSVNLVIDHHPDTGSKTSFQDIRPKYGATASILTEYLRAARIKPAIKLATALLLGIKNDTSNFEQQTLVEDVRSFQYLFRHANKHLVRKIEQSEIRPDYLKYFKKALESRRVRKGKVFVFLGLVPNPDICVIIADFFSKVSSIKWSIVAGYHQKKLVIIFRSDGLRKNAGKIAEQGFAEFGSAGGRKAMARAEIDLTMLRPIIDHKDDSKVVRWIMNQLKTKTKTPPADSKK